MQAKSAACLAALILVAGCASPGGNGSSSGSAGSSQVGATATTTGGIDSATSGATSAPSSGPVVLTGARLPQMAKVADLPGGHVSGLAYAPSDANVLYLTSDVNAMGVWKSTDGGGSWTRVAYDMTMGVDHLAGIAVKPDDADVAVAVGIGGRILRTGDGGTTWTWVRDPVGQVPPGQVPDVNAQVPNWAVAFSPSQPDTVYVGAEDGSILVSSDAGATWTMHGQVLPHQGPMKPAVQSLAVDPQDPEHVMAGTHLAIDESKDGGATWHKVRDVVPAQFTVPTSGDVTALAWVAAAPKLVLAAGPAGVLRSTDGGASWSSVQSGHAHSVVLATDGKTAWVASRSGVFRSTDAGATWTHRDSGVPITDGRIAVSPTAADVAVLGNDIWQWQGHADPDFPSTEGEGLFRTSDGGQSWTRSEGGFIDTDPSTVAVDPQDPNLVYVGSRCSRGLYRSPDGGQSWQLMPGGPVETNFALAHYTMRMQTQPNGEVLLTARFGFTQSTDHGESWKSTLPERHFHGLGVEPSDPKTVFIGTSYAVDPPNDANNYPGIHILRSRDGGSHWSDVSQGLPKSGGTVIERFAFDAADPKTIYAATSSMDVLDFVSGTAAYGVFKSTDGGDTWAAANTGLESLEVEGLAAAPGILYAGTMDGLYRSTDGAATWTKADLAAPVIDIVVDPADSHHLYAGTEHGLHESKDEGLTWSRLDAVPDKPVEDVTMDAAGKVLYAVVPGDGIYRGIA